MKKEESILSGLFKAMINASPMGIVVWKLKEGEWILDYANSNAAQYIFLNNSTNQDCLAKPRVNNLGKVDLIKAFNEVVKTGKSQEVVIKHSLIHRRAQVSLIPLGQSSVISYYLNIDPVLRKENELKTAIRQLSHFNSSMSGREDELVDMENKMKSLKLKLKLITTKKSLSYEK